MEGCGRRFIFFLSSILNDIVEKINPAVGIADGGIPWHYRKEDIPDPVPEKEGRMMLCPGRASAAVLNVANPRCLTSSVAVVEPIGAVRLFILRMN